MKARLTRTKAGLKFPCQEMEMLALAGLHFWKRGLNRRFKAGEHLAGAPPFLGHAATPALGADAALEPRAQSEVLQAGSRGLEELGN